MNNKLDNKNIKIYWLTFIACTGALLSIIGGYFSGSPLLSSIFKIVDWALGLVLAILAENIFSNFKGQKKIISYIPFIILLSRIPYSFDFFYFVARYTNNDFSFYQYYDLIIFTSTNIILFLCLFVLISSSRRLSIPSDIKVDDIKQNTDDFQKTRKQYNNNQVVINQTINSIQSRIKSSNQMIYMSLFIMIAVIIIGCIASFGTLAMDEASKIRDLEQARKTLIALESNLSGIKSTISDSTIIDNDKFNVLKKNMDEAKIIFEYYKGNTQEFNEKIEKIEKQSNTSWTDIAVRISIATLTLFLADTVQNFV